MKKKTNIIWELGSAYDLFCSLRVLHDPNHYGLRPAWAAGVRSRVPVEHRVILEQVQSFVFVPREWIFKLRDPKDVKTALWYLSILPPEERLLTLIEGCGVPQEVLNILINVKQRGNWTPDDQEKLRSAYQSSTTPPRAKNLIVMLELISKAFDSGEKLMAALNAYQRVFFAEEEARIDRYLTDAVSTGKGKAEQVPFEELIETLSRGVRLGAEPLVDEWIMIPSYWISPLVSINRKNDQTAFFMFGCRPPDVSLVPGELVPEGIQRPFKSLGDPTRLRILRYLAQENISPAEIARRLRLRAPTVTHHLNVLRLAGLVYLTIGEKNERLYAARMEAIDELFEGVKDFLTAHIEGD